MCRLLQVGWFPTYTLTEDYALGIELKKERFQCRYVRDYLALGEHRLIASSATHTPHFHSSSCVR